MSDSTETLIRSLHTRKNRERRGLTLAEGVRLVEEVLASGTVVKVAVTSPALEATPRGAQLAAALRAKAERTEVLEDRALAGLASTEHPQGVIAVVVTPHQALDAIRVSPKSVILVLDAVQDPGNVGTMVRTAWTLGAAGVIALPGTAEFTNPKALRATMGACFHLASVAASHEEALDWLGRHQVKLWVTDAGGEDVRQARRSGPIALVVGNEGAGVSPALSTKADRTVGIPIRKGAESLNVGVAAGILLYEVLREP